MNSVEENKDTSPDKYSYFSIALITFTFLDSISAFYTSTTGATKTQIVLYKLSPDLFKHFHIWFPSVVGVTLFFSQFNYSFVLYKRDGKLWRILAEMYIPKWLKNMLKMTPLPRPTLDGHKQPPINTLYQIKKTVLSMLWQQSVCKVEISKEISPESKEISPA